MLLSEIKELKFDLYDYPESKERQGLAEKIASNLSNELLSADDVMLLDDSDFALVIKEGTAKLRKYPLCNAKTAEISKLFLQAHTENIPSTLAKLAERNINDFITKGKFGNNVITTKELYALEKEAEVDKALSSRGKLADSDYALVIGKGDIKTRLYPINDEHNCKLASEYFSKNKGNIPVHLRHDFAKALILKCASAGFDSKSIITNDIKSYCNNKLNPDFEFEISCRKDKVASAKVHEALDTLLDASKDNNLIKIANLLYKLDKDLGFDKYYNKSFSDPYRAVFSNENNITNKQASLTPVGEYDIDPQTLAAIPYTDQMQQLFSQDDFNAVTQDPAAYQALPMPYKQAMKQAINHNKK